MHTLRFIALAIVALPWPAHAETTYTNVTLAPGITIDVPSAVATDFNAPGGTADDLMFISLTRSDATMDCLLIRIPYTAEMPRAKTVEMLSANKHGGLCSGATREKSVSDLVLEALGTATTSGRPAGSCVASYTDASKKPPGRVATTYAVAEEEKLYLLNCDIAADTQDDAMADWYVAWSDSIARMEKSLRLP